MSSPKTITNLARLFLQPANSTHRQYEALRAYFVEGLSGAEVAARFGYAPGSFRVLVHHFRQDPKRRFFLRRIDLPGSRMIPAAHAVRSLLALKLFRTARHPHVISAVLDEGLALFAGLNVIPKRSFLTKYSCRIDPACYPTLMRRWFEAMGKLGLPRDNSFDLDFHTIPFHGEEALVEKHYVSKRSRSPLGGGSN